MELLCLLETFEDNHQQYCTTEQTAILYNRHMISNIVQQTYDQQYCTTEQTAILYNKHMTSNIVQQNDTIRTDIEGTH